MGEVPRCQSEVGRSGRDGASAGVWPKGPARAGNLLPPVRRLALRFWRCFAAARSGAAGPVCDLVVRAFARAGISSKNRRLILKAEGRNETRRTKSVAAYSSFIIPPFAFEMSLVVPALTGQGVFQPSQLLLRAAARVVLFRLTRADGLEAVLGHSQSQ